jgi:hypothetical protein
MLSHLYLLINKEYLAIPQKYDKLILSLRTAIANEYSPDKEQTSYDDLLDALRLSLKGYRFNELILSQTQMHYPILSSNLPDKTLEVNDVAKSRYKMLFCYFGVLIRRNGQMRMYRPSTKELAPR